MTVTAGFQIVRLRELLISKVEIRLNAAPFFLGNELEAFYGRGENDFYMSHDLEDFIAVIEGREQLLEELAATPTDLREYLGKQPGSF
jgi:hypothetical protein